MSRGLGDVYKRQLSYFVGTDMAGTEIHADTDTDIDENGSENNHADIDIERFVIFFYLCHKILSVTGGTVFASLLLL